MIDLEGNELRVLNVGRGTEHSTVLHVPSIDAVVAGDIVYNQVHIMVAETDPRTREEWIAANDAIEALEPRIVVSGHKRVGAADSSATLKETRQYLRDFSRIADEQPNHRRGARQPTGHLALGRHRGRAAQPDVVDN